MTIQESSFILRSGDLNCLIEKFVTPTKKVSTLNAELQNDKLVISGRANTFFEINFQAIVALSHTNTEIIARLEQLGPMSGIMAQFKGKILSTIAEKADFIELDKAIDTIRIKLNQAAGKGLSASHLNIRELSIVEGTLRISLQGELSF